MQPPSKSPQTLVQAQEPLNVETPLGPLRESFVTPRDLFYVRNHGTIPEVDPDSYRLSVSGMVQRSLELSLEELRNEFPEETVVATVHCAGNRRQGLIEAYPLPGELPWGAGALGNARWAGVPLKEVLAAAGVGEGVRHVAFEGLDEISEGTSPSFGGSIPLHKALGPEVLLAYQMNGEPLMPEHGFPLRVVVPGYIGARSVKWLSRITLQDAPSENYFQAQQYRLFPPYVLEEPDGPSVGFPLGEISVSSVICSPWDGEPVEAGPITFRGYALAGGGRDVVRVDLTPDDGETWVGADVSEGKDQPWAWRFWEATLDLVPGPHRVSVRALDSAADTQPQDARGIWNVKGYVNNAWHRVRVTAR